MAKPQIYFETNNYAVRKFAPIKPASEFVPEKFRNLPTKIKEGDHRIDDIFSVKICPGIQDYIGLGYVIPAWCDMEFIPNNDEMFVRYSDPNNTHAVHYKDQIGDFLDTKFKVRTPIKLDNPWLTYAEKNWSILYLPMLYHEDQNFEAVPGVIDHDKGALVSPINIMVKEHKQFEIKQGTPIVQAIPFQRQVVTARTGKVRTSTLDRLNAINSLFSMTFKGWRKFMTEKKIFKVDSNDTKL